MTTAVVTPAPNAQGWNATSPVTVTFSATDVDSGVAYTEYSADGGTWTRGASCAVTADGTTEVRYRSADNAGNVEQAETQTVKLDGVRPVPLALANATVKKGQKATLKLRVNDVSPTCTLKVVIRNARGGVVKEATTTATRTDPARSASPVGWRRGATPGGCMRRTRPATPRWRPPRRSWP